MTTARGYTLDASLEQVGLNASAALRLHLTLRNRGAAAHTFDPRRLRVKTDLEQARAAWEGAELVLPPGSSATVEVTFPTLRWQPETGWCVLLGGPPSEPRCSAAPNAGLALDLGADFAAPLPLPGPSTALVPVAPSVWVATVRLGGGAGLTRRGVSGGLGGLELAYGWRGEHVGVHVLTRLGFGTAAGLDTRFHVPLALGRLVPTIGYGITSGLDASGFLVGHGPRFGVGWELPNESEGPFSMPWHASDWGPYVAVTPVFAFERGPLVAGVWVALEAGVGVSF